MSLPIKISRKPQKQKARVNKSGEQTAWKCPFCTRSWVLRTGCKSHMRNCRSRGRELDVINQRLIIEDVNVVQQEINHPMPSDIQTMVDQHTQQINKLKSMMSGFTKTIPFSEIKPENYSAQAELLVKQFFSESTKSTIMGLLQKVVYETIYSGFTQGNDMREKLYQIRGGLYEKMKALSLQDSIDSWQQKLRMFHDNITQNKTGSNLSRFRAANKILKSYNQYQIRSQVKFTNDLLHMSPYIKSCVLTYYRMMKDNYPTLFGIYPKISNLVKGYSSVKKNILPSITLQDVRQQVFSLISQNPSLACDIWTISCIGLRGPDIKRVKFHTTSGFYASSLSIIQQKNRNIATRIIPHSLVRLICETQTNYPITPNRWISVRLHCLRKFKRFYGLRSLCITSVSTALLASASRLGRFHLNPSTTTSFYIDKQNTEYINQAFSLQFPSTKQLLDQVNVHLQFGSSYIPKQIIGAEKKLFETFDTEEYQKDLVEIIQSDSTLGASVIDIKQMLSENQEGYKKEQCTSILLNNFTLKNFGQQIQTEPFSNLCEVFKVFLGEPTIVQLLKIGVIKRFLNISSLKGDQIQIPYLQNLSFDLILQQIKWNESNLLQYVSYIYMTRLLFFQWEQGEMQPFNKEFYGNSGNPPLLIHKVSFITGPGYYISESKLEFKPIENYEYKTLKEDFLLRWEKMEIQQQQEHEANITKFKSMEVAEQKIQRISKIKAIESISKSAKIQFQRLPQLKKPEPKCSKSSCKGKPILEECHQTEHRHFHLKCQQCKTIQNEFCRDWSKMKNNGLYKQQTIRIVSNSKRVSNIQLKQLNFLQQKNNIAQMVAEKYQFTQKPWYLRDIPKQFCCNYVPFSHQMSQTIIRNRKNEEYLPLQIRQSDIPNAGLGVFATKNIEQNTLICSYLGEIATHQSIENSDSLYTLGWIGRKCLMICPRKYSNVGRFLNTSKDFKNNCRPSLGVVEYNVFGRKTLNEEPKYEVIIYIYSVKQIEAGQQLLYPYGQLYSFQNISSNSQEDL